MKLIFQSKSSNRVVTKQRPRSKDLKRIIPHLRSSAAIPIFSELEDLKDNQDVSVFEEWVEGADDDEMWDSLQELSDALQVSRRLHP